MEKKRFRIEIRKLDVENPSWSRMENGKEIFYLISEVYSNQEEYGHKTIYAKNITEEELKEVKIVM